MNKYIITGPKFIGHILLWYRNQFLVKLSFDECELNPEQKDWFLHSLSILEESLQPVFGTMKDKATGKNMFIILQEIEVVTFDDFYNAYGYREGKKKAETSWNKLSVADKAKAFTYIQRYKRKVQSACIAMAYPATYLNSKRWED